MFGMNQPSDSVGKNTPENLGFYTTREAARLLGVSLRTAQVWCEQNLLEAWKTEGGHRRISADSVRRLMAQRQGARDGDLTAQKPVEPFALRLLVVEDDVAMIRLYRARIATWPFPTHLTCLNNCYEALVEVGSDRPHLLISDLRLPGLDGFDMLRAICRLESLADMEIAAVTGLSISEIDQRGGLPSRIHYFSKPIDFFALEALAARIAEKCGVIADAVPGDGTGSAI